MKSLDQWPLHERRGLHGILTDIDDTLTTHGSLTPDVLGALARLHSAGLRLIAVTGRPTYWAQPLLRLCGFDAVIAENGASAFWLDARGVQQAWFYADAVTRRRHREVLDAFALTLQARFPQVPLADDAPQRIGDLAFDIGENVAPLAAGQVDDITGFIRDKGFFALSSSIHVHASLAQFSKQVTSAKVLQEVFGVEDAIACEHFAFIGDSGNDASMFAHYPHSIGVANIARFVERLPRPPAYVTQQACGAGFVEAAEFILKAKT